MLIVAVGLREIPDGALRLVIAPTTEDPRAGMVINEFVGPLPDVSNHIHHAKGTCPSRMRIHLIRSAH